MAREACVLILDEIDTRCAVSGLACSQPKIAKLNASRHFSLMTHVREIVWVAYGSDYIIEQARMHVS